MPGEVKRVLRTEQKDGLEVVPHSAREDSTFRDVAPSFGYSVALKTVGIFYKKAISVKLKILSL